MPRTTSTTQTDRGGLPPIDEEPFDWEGDGDGGGGNFHQRGASRKTSMIGLAVMMSASVMTFAALASALIIRRGMGHDWVKMPLPWILWPNTGILLLSSVVLDTARRLLKRGRRVAFNWLWLTGTLLGAVFLAGQTLAWTELHARKVFLASNPSNGFFYALTWTHAAHAVAGLLALIYVAVMALRFRLGPRKRTVVEVSTMFWHFLDVLWILLMLMFIYYQVSEMIATRGQRGMAISLSADLLFFVALFANYVYVRVHAPVWPSEFHFASGLMAAAITFFTFAGSVTMFYAARHQVSQSYEIAMRLAIATLAVWASVVILMGMEWVRLIVIMDFGFTTNAFSIFYFTLSGFYLLHVIVGIAYTGAVAARIRTADVGAAAIYAHATNLIWLFVFIGVYLASTDLQGL